MKDIVREKDNGKSMNFNLIMKCNSLNGMIRIAISID